MLGFLKHLKTTAASICSLGAGIRHSLTHIYWAPNMHLTLAVHKACQLLHSLQATSHPSDSQGMTCDKAVIRKAALALRCYQLTLALAKVRQKKYIWLFSWALFGEGFGSWKLMQGLSSWAVVLIAIIPQVAKLYLQCSVLLIRLKGTF